MTPNPEQSERLLALAARCEAATGTDRGLDAEIELATGNWSECHYEAWCRFQECGEAANPPMAQPCDPRWLTSSIDAAMMLVPDGAEVLCGIRQTSDTIPWARVGFWNTHDATGASLALAVCNAALRARARAGDGA